MEDLEQKIHFPCPRCGKRLAAPSALAGKRMPCPNKGCGEMVVVPAAQQPGAESIKPAPSETTADPPEAVGEQKRDEEARGEAIGKRSGRKKRKKRPAASSSRTIWLLVGGGVLASLVLIGGVVALILNLRHGGESKQASRKSADTEKAVVEKVAKAPAVIPQARKEPTPTVEKVAPDKPVVPPPTRPADLPAPDKPTPPTPPSTPPTPPPPAPAPAAPAAEEEKPKLVREFALQGDKIKIPLAAVAISRDGKQALSSSLGPAVLGLGVRLHDVETGREVYRFDAVKEDVPSLAFSPDGRRALIGCDDSRMRLWDLGKSRELRVFPSAPVGMIRRIVNIKSDGGHVLLNLLGVALSPDGRLAVSGGGSLDSVVRLWDMSTGKEIAAFKGHKGAAPALAFSADGHRLLSGGWDSTVRLWDVKTRKQLKLFEGHSGLVQSVAFSPDGSQILSGGADKTLLLWDVESGRTLRRMEDAAGSVNSAAFLEDGARAVSGSGGDFQVETVPEGTRLRFSVGKTGTVRLWDLKTGRALWNSPDHAQAVLKVAAVPKSPRVISVTAQGTLRVWELPAAK